MTPPTRSGRGHDVAPPAGLPVGRPGESGRDDIAEVLTRVTRLARHLDLDTMFDRESAAGVDPTAA